MNDGLVIGEARLLADTRDVHLRLSHQFIQILIDLYRYRSALRSGPFDRGTLAEEHHRVTLDGVPRYAADRPEVLLLGLDEVDRMAVEVDDAREAAAAEKGGERREVLELQGLRSCLRVERGSGLTGYQAWRKYFLEGHFWAPFRTPFLWDGTDLAQASAVLTWLFERRG